MPMELEEAARVAQGLIDTCDLFADTCPAIEDHEIEEIDDEEDDLPPPPAEPLTQRTLRMKIDGEEFVITAYRRA